MVTKTSIHLFFLCILELISLGRELKSRIEIEVLLLRLVLIVQEIIDSLRPVVFLLVLSQTNSPELVLLLISGFELTHILIIDRIVEDPLQPARSNKIILFCLVLLENLASRVSDEIFRVH